MSHTPEQHSHNGAGYEKREVDIRIIIETLIGLAISVVITCVIVWAVFFLFKKTSPGRVSADSGVTQVPSGPRIQVHPAEELIQLRADEDQVLNSYRWVDSKTGVVHIPIEKAIDEVVGKLPARPPTPGGPNAAKH